MEINNKNTATPDDNTGSQAGGENVTGENAQGQSADNGATNDGDKPEIEDESAKGEDQAKTVKTEPSKDLKVERHQKPAAKPTKKDLADESEDEDKKNRLKNKKTLDALPGKPSASAPENNAAVADLASKPVVRFYNKGTRREQKLPGKTLAKLYSKAPDNFTILED